MTFAVSTFRREASRSASASASSRSAAARSFSAKATCSCLARSATSTACSCARAATCRLFSFSTAARSIRRCASIRLTCASRDASASTLVISARCRASAAFSALSFIEQHVADTHALDVGEVERWLASPEATQYAWPGNVRELQNVLRDLMLGLDPRSTRFKTEPNARSDLPTAVLEASAPLAVCEAWYLEHVLARHEGNHSEAARVLGIDRSTLYRRLKRSRRGFGGTSALRSDDATR